ncbi:hypothetical protein GJ496_006111 [Pomphorhynchus laevis]|nr:hypothetical protein GJ496_006111 [Pomphorhynchus laevis]
MANFVAKKLPIPMHYREIRYIERCAECIERWCHIENAIGVTLRTQMFCFLRRNTKYMIFSTLNFRVDIDNDLQYYDICRYYQKTVTM